jgi:hypothetical protein
MDSYTITDIYGNIEKHLVLTGTTTGIRSDALVDMTLFSSIPSPPTYSNFFAFFSNDGNESLDDVVVTDSLVVVSTRNIVQGLPVIDFLHINKPYSMGQSIFSFPVNHLTLGSPVADSPVLLEHETNNKYAATFKNSGSHTMSMLQLTGPSIVNNCLRIFMDNYETDIPMELKYNRFSSVYDLLAHHYSARNPDYYLMFQIYHITPDVINNIVPYGDITFFNNSTVWSIDPTKNAYFVASGDSTNYPKWFRYKHDTWENCPRPSAYEYFNEKLPSKDYQTDRLFFEGFFYREEKLIPIPFTIDISNTCKQ